MLQRCFSTLALTLLLVAAEATLGAPSVNDFARLPEYEMARISPTGNHLAVTLRRDGRRALLVLDRKTLQITATVNFSPPNEVASFAWVNDERIVIAMAFTYGALDFPVTTGELYAINADGSEARMIIDSRSRRFEDRPERYRGVSRIMQRLPNDAGHVLVQTASAERKPGNTVVEASLMDVYHGRLTRLVRAPLRGGALISNSNADTFYSIARDDGLQLKIHRSGREQDWQLLAAYEFTQGEMVPMAVADDQRTLIVLDNTHNNTRSVYAFDPSSRELRALFSSADADVEEVLLDNAGAPYAVRYQPAWPQYHLLNAQSRYARFLTLMMARFPNANVDITSSTSDGRLAVATVVSDRNPGELYLLDAESGAVSFLLGSRRWLRPEDMRETKPVQFTSKDGKLIPGYVTTPAGTPPFPMVVLPHGGPHFVRDDGMFDDTVQLLAQHGYLVLQVNFRGSSGFGREFLTAGFGHWGDLIQQDIAAGAHWAIAQKLAAPRRACIYGASFGAYAALMNPILEPGLYRCAIGLAGVYDVADLYERGDVSQHRLGFAYLTQVVGDDRASLEGISPRYLAARVHIPVLLGHGAKDVRAPISQSRQMRDALHAIRPKSERDTATLIEFAQEGHGLYDTDNRVRWYEALLAFLSRHTADPKRAVTPDEQPATSAATPLD